MPTEDTSTIARLEEENTELLNFLYACPVGLMEISADGAIGMITPVAMQLLLKLQVMPSMNLFTDLSNHGPELRNLVESYAPAQGTVCEALRILVRVGTLKKPDSEVFSCTVVKLNAERFMVSMSEISNQVRQERKLKEAETWFSSLLSSGGDFGVASLDQSGFIASVSAAVSKQTGFDKHDLVGQSLQFLEVVNAPEGKLSAAEQLSLASRDGWHLHEDWQRQKDGSKVWYQRLVAVRHEQTESHSPDVSGYTVVLREGQPHSLDAHNLKQMLTRDHLTGTYNRMHFFEVGAREIARKKRYEHALSLVMVDIDHFKRVNDKHGHAAGDQVLKRVTDCCAALLRPVDTMARIGGEEFAILLPETNIEGAKLLAERLRIAISEVEITVGSAQLQMTASFGCAEHEDQGSLTDLLANTDTALYKAKKVGRNCVVVYGADN